MQPTPRPEGEAACDESRLTPFDLRVLVARLRAEAAALRTESDGRRGLLDLAKTQLAEKEAEIAALRTENNRHKERAKTYDDTEEERYTRLLAENGRLGKQLAERDAEAAAQTARVADMEQQLRVATMTIEALQNINRLKDEYADKGFDLARTIAAVPK